MAQGECLRQPPIAFTTDCLFDRQILFHAQTQKVWRGGWGRPTGAPRSMKTKPFNQSNQSGGIGSTDSGTVLKSSYHGALDQFQSRGRSTSAPVVSGGSRWSGKQSILSRDRVRIGAEPFGQLDPQSGAVQSVGVLIGSPSFVAGK
jgi:hypothetical protein